MFIALTAAETGVRVYVNMSLIKHFWRAAGWTVMYSVEAKFPTEVQETPDEILKLLAGGHEQ
jgi:hypothetical protein